jgi:hypothetical protein
LKVRPAPKRLLIAEVRGRRNGAVLRGGDWCARRPASRASVF